MSFNDVECACEATGTSQFGPVLDHEFLVRIIVSPIHVNPKTGRVTPGAFPSADLMERGLSVLRASHMDEGELTKQGTALCKGKPDRSVLGYMVGATGEIRALRDNADRKAFCAVDDRLEDQEMHATVMRSADQDELEIKALRGHLMDIFATMLGSASEIQGFQPTA